MQNLKNRIEVKLVNNERDHLKCTSKPNCMSQKISENNLVAIQKSKVSLKLNKPAYIGMRILELGKVLMCEFHYDYMKNKYGNQLKLLFTGTDSFMHEIKTEDVYEDFSSNKEMFDFSNDSTKSKYYDYSNKLVIGKMNDETGCVVTGEFVGLKTEIYSTIVSIKKQKDVNRNVVTTISHNEYKDNKCLRHSKNRTQSKDHRTRTYEMNKISLFCFDDKIYFQSNGYDRLALGY